MRRADPSFRGVLPGVACLHELSINVNKKVASDLTGLLRGGAPPPPGGRGRGAATALLGPRPPSC
jgi:hypothetical protein